MFLRYQQNILPPLFCALLFAIPASGQTYDDAIRPFWNPQPAGSYASSLANNLTITFPGQAFFSPNPANLALTRQPALAFSLQYDHFNQNATFESRDESSNLSNRVFRFDGLAFVVPIKVYRGSWALGLSYSPTNRYHDVMASKGLLATSDNFTVFLDQRYREEGILNTFRLGTAVEFQPNLFVGLGCSFHRGYRDYNYTGTDTDLNDKYQYSRYTYQESFKPTYTGWNGDLGLIYRSRFFMFGWYLATPTYLHVTDTRSSTTEEIEDDQSVNNTAENSILEYKLRSPLGTSVAAAFLYKGYMLTCELTVRDWETLHFSSDLYLDTTFTTRLDPLINRQIRNNLRTTFDVGLAFSWPLSARLQGQLGSRLVARPFVDLPEGEAYLQQLSCGIEGWLDKQIKLQLSYQLQLGQRVVYNGLFTTPDAANPGSERSSYSRQKSQLHRLTLTLSMVIGA